MKKLDNVLVLLAVVLYSRPQGFVIRAEGLCGFQIRSYITRGLQIPVNRKSLLDGNMTIGGLMTDLGLNSALATPSVANPCRNNLNLPSKNCCFVFIKRRFTGCKEALRTC